MHDFSAAHIKKMVIHFVGNKANDETIKLSEHHVRSLTVEEEELLLRFFTKPFNVEEYYTFHHHTDLDLNETYNYINELWLTPVNFIDASKKLARHLYAHSVHPRINGGEFFVVEFSDVVLDGELVSAIGLFKSEQKSTFMDISEGDSSLDPAFHAGIDIKKLDKGCLIFNTDAEGGFRVLTHDHSSKSEEAQYWKDDFLCLKPQSTEYTQTREYMHMCKNFVMEELPKSFEVDRAKQIEILNRSSGYFTDNDEIVNEEFGKAVFDQPEVIDTFNNYKQRYQEERGVEIDDQFAASKQAVKAGKKFFKSVLKLDKNFHIYVHGNPENIEQGFDELRGMKFYKVFYNEEK